MLFSTTRLVTCLPKTSQGLAVRGLGKPFSTRPTGNTSHEQELRAARDWLARFNGDTIPRNIGNVTFSRASGPGGQNVNKVNSKATLRIPIQSLLCLVPTALHTEIRASRFCRSASDHVVIQADDSRKQTDNAHNCYAKLHRMIVEAGERVIPGETSPAQRERVRVLQKEANEQRLKTKKFHSNKKSARQGRRDIDD